REFVAVAGPSGSGKSTLMHIIGCLDVPTTGVYRLAGADVSSLGEDQLADVRNRRIGFVFQQFNLLAYMPAWRNVELPLLYTEVERTERRARAYAALEQVGLGARADPRPAPRAHPRGGGGRRRRDPGHGRRPGRPRRRPPVTWRDTFGTSIE